MRKLLRRRAVIFVLPGMVLAWAAWAGVVSDSRKKVRMPAVDIGVQSLAARKAAQEKTVQDFKVLAPPSCTC